MEALCQLDLTVESAERIAKILGVIAGTEVKVEILSEHDNPTTQIRNLQLCGDREKVMPVLRGMWHLITWAQRFEMACLFAEMGNVEATRKLAMNTGSEHRTRH